MSNGDKPAVRVHVTAYDEHNVAIEQTTIAIPCKDVDQAKAIYWEVVKADEAIKAKYANQKT